MFNTVEEYLEALKKVLQGSDAALIQDVLADAREYLSMALEAAREKNPDVNEAEALQPIVEQYGTPEEIVSAYRVIERRTSYPLKQIPFGVRPLAYISIRVPGARSCLCSLPLSPALFISPGR
jgi:hypothetical protein